ncbi:MAG: UMP kinase [Clostridia bacterium]|nr:UMP kinase [Clostridia bacterium]
MIKMKYKRVLIKISGEALAGESGHGIDFEKAIGVCEKIKTCLDQGVQIAIVVGAGNFWRGRNGNNMDHTRADHMGMLATMMNCLALQDTFIKIGVDARVLAAIDMQQFAEPYIRDKAVNHLEAGRVVIFGCGTGNPFVTTDTAAAMRAVEISADIALLAKNVNGVYDKDPKTHPDAKRFEKITYMDVLTKELSVIDTTATALCKDNDMPVLLFELGNGDNIVRAIQGEHIGTVITKN